MNKFRGFSYVLWLLLSVLSGFLFFGFLVANGYYVSWPLCKQGVYSDFKLKKPSDAVIYISDPATDSETRCRAIFALCANSVCYGTTSKEFSDIFPDKKWIDSSKIRIVKVEGGRSALQGGGNCSHVVIALFPEDKMRPWSIHLCIEGDDNEQGAINFLKNVDTSKFTKIKSFSLVCPRGLVGFRIEQFYWWGMRLEYMP